MGYFWYLPMPPQTTGNDPDLRVAEAATKGWKFIGICKGQMTGAAPLKSDFTRQRLARLYPFTC